LSSLLLFWLVADVAGSCAGSGKEVTRTVKSSSLSLSVGSSVGSSRAGRTGGLLIANLGVSLIITGGSDTAGSENRRARSRMDSAGWRDEGAGSITAGGVVGTCAATRAGSIIGGNDGGVMPCSMIGADSDSVWQAISEAGTAIVCADLSFVVMVLSVGVHGSTTSPKGALVCVATSTPRGGSVCVATSRVRGCSVCVAISFR